MSFKLIIFSEDILLIDAKNIDIAIAIEVILRIFSLDSTKSLSSKYDRQTAGIPINPIKIKKL